MVRSGTKWSILGFFPDIFRTKSDYYREVCLLKNEIEANF